VRVAALYDVHGNLPALEAVLAEVEQAQVDRIVLGGDVLAGPWPEETWARVAALGGRALVVRGNADRELDAWQELVRTWPLTVTLDVDGLGRVLFCHATPRSDEEILTAATPEGRVREALGGVDADVVVHGHVHVRYDRRAGACRVVNPGSVGLPYEGRAGAYWAVLGPGVEFRRTEYDVDAMVAAARAAGYEDVDARFGPSLLEPVAPETVTQHFEALARGA